MARVGTARRFDFKSSLYITNSIVRPE